MKKFLGCSKHNARPVRCGYSGFRTQDSEFRIKEFWKKGQVCLVKARLGQSRNVLRKMVRESRKLALPLPVKNCKITMEIKSLSPEN